MSLFDVHHATFICSRTQPYFSDMFLALIDGALYYVEPVISFFLRLVCLEVRTGNKGSMR
jgi:hypothetical protein